MIIDDAVNNVGVTDDPFVNVDMPLKDPVEGNISVVPAGLPWKDIIFCPDGPEGDYISHPLNFVKSEGLGDIIRGVTGYLQRFANVETLKLALVSIIFGFLKFKRELAQPKTDKGATQNAGA